MNTERRQPRKPYRVKTKHARWTNADGTIDELVKLFGGTRSSMAIDYTEIPALITDLRRLLNEHEKDPND